MVPPKMRKPPLRAGVISNQPKSRFYIKLMKYLFNCGTNVKQFANNQIDLNDKNIKKYPYLF